MNINRLGLTNINRIASTKKLNQDTLSYILLNLRDMLESGIPVLTSIEIIENNLNSPRGKSAIREIKTNIKNGYSISEAFGKVRGMPDLCVEMLKIGEDTGKLDKILTILSDYYRKIYKLKKEIRSSLIYPSILIVMIIGIVIFMYMFLVPSFKEMYSSINIKPNGVVDIIFTLRGYTDENPMIFLVGVMIYGLILPIVLIKYLVKILIEKNILRVKVFYLFREYFLLMILYLIFESGINIQQAFNRFSKEIQWKLISKYLKSINSALLKGESISNVLSIQGIFSKYTLAMINIGETNGRLNENISRALEKLEKELLTRSKIMAKMVQPISIFIISFIIVGVIAAFLLPLYEGINI